MRPQPTLAKGEPSKEELDGFARRLLAHNLAGVKLLFEHYRIPESDIDLQLLLLVFKLGKAHVPFFETPRTGKPGPVTDVHGYLSLELDLMLAKKPSDRGDLPALKRLLTTRKYSSYHGGEESLRKKLRRGRQNPWVDYLRQMAMRDPRFLVAPDRGRLDDMARRNPGRVHPT